MKAPGTDRAPRALWTVFLFLCLGSSPSFGQALFSKATDDGLPEWPRISTDIHSSQCGFVVGTIMWHINVPPMSDFFISEFDEQGELQARWRYDWSLDADMVVRPTPPRYYVAGTSLARFDDHEESFIVFSTNRSDGEIIRSRRILAPAEISRTVGGIEVAFGGGIVVAGSAAGWDASSKDMFLANFHKNLDERWAKVLASDHEVEAQAVTIYSSISDPPGYCMVGTDASDRIVIATLDRHGNLGFGKVIDVGERTTKALDVDFVGDGFIIVGDTAGDGLVLKLDMAGELDTFYKYDGGHDAEYFTSVGRARDGMFFVGRGADSESAIVGKLAENQGVDWVRRFDGVSGSSVPNLAVTGVQDGRAVMASVDADGELHLISCTGIAGEACTGQATSLSIRDPGISIEDWSPQVLDLPGNHIINDERLTRVSAWSPSEVIECGEGSTECPAAMRAVASTEAHFIKLWNPWEEDGPDTLITGTSDAWGIDMARDGSTIWWTDRESMTIGALDITGENVDSTWVQNVDAFNVDYHEESGKVFWGDRSSMSIQCADAETGDVQTIVSGLSGAPVDIEIDPLLRRVYWSEEGIGVRSAGLDGGDVETAVSTSAPIGIALDTDARTLYWLDGLLGGIWWADLDGGAQDSLISTAAVTWDVEFHPETGKILWTELDSRIMRANADGSGVEELAEFPVRSIAFGPVEPTVVGVDLDQTVVRAEALLGQNAPNPFHRSTAIAYRLDEPARVSLRIYDVGGRLVRTLIGRGERGTGEHRVVWDGRGDDRRRVAPGIYFYHVRIGEDRATRRMVILE
ncbi:MAG: T9SS type A sorting domain-containing protein [Candidatus Eisenbacteria bacterium]|nr:T9SS type A sorting domain-containing protein [Candidatus Latescibacterota bacterium]MBD3302068.1 T9SS type A sorting domain-containing protein [Candidatus Eisenbacteria bacterium]